MGIYYLLSVFSGISIAMCLFSAIYLWIGVKEKSLKKTILIFLILAISLRLLKSILFYVASSQLAIMPTLGIIIGFLGFSTFGPLSYWYFKFNRDHNDFHKTEYLHLIFPILGAIVLGITEKLDTLMYLLCNLSFALYLAYIYFKFFFNRKQTNGSIPKLDRYIFITMLALLIVFLIQYFTATLQLYVIGTGISSIIIAGLFVYMLKYPPNLIKAIHKTIPKPEQVDSIVKALEVEKVYHKSNISLTEFSKLIDVPKYIISTTIKEKYQKSFPELINHMRINDIVSRLKHPDSVNIKIEDLAFDVGFNSTSSFYTAFKKETAMTPRAFQKDIILKY